MARFLQETDYDMQIKSEIRRLLDGSLPTDTQPPLKLLRAENTAISQIRNWLGNRYDCDAIFTPVGATDNRDQFIVTVTIDITLYHLYSQTGNKDVPKHRAERYQDAVDWLQAAGKGQISANLHMPSEEENPGDVRIFSEPVQCHRW